MILVSLITLAIGLSWHTELGFLGLCALAWVSFFAAALGRDWCGGAFISLTGQLFLLTATVIICATGEQGELGRALLLGIIPVYGACVMWTFLKRVKSGNALKLIQDR